CTSRRSPQPLNPPPTLSFSSTKPAGTCRHVSSYRPTLPSSRCHPNVPSSTRLRTCGSSCATTGFQTESSNHTTISSTIVARPGTSSSISLGASCPSDCANGRTSSDQWDSVLAHISPRVRFLHWLVAIGPFEHVLVRPLDLFTLFLFLLLGLVRLLLAGIFLGKCGHRQRCDDRSYHKGSHFRSSPLQGTFSLGRPQG